uniref:ARAD1C42108p n=1 Tax=Blastobotrys adeninivorans TaxID=409370 RepID=A0A060T470_BLAAD
MDLKDIVSENRDSPPGQRSPTTSSSSRPRSLPSPEPSPDESSSQPPTGSKRRLDSGGGDQPTSNRLTKRPSTDALRDSLRQAKPTKDIGTAKESVEPKAELDTAGTETTPTNSLSSAPSRATSPRVWAAPSLDSLKAPRPHAPLRKHQSTDSLRAPSPSIPVMAPTTISSTSSSSRRHAHILSEQRRRENINEGFQHLKNAVPFCRGTQDSKAMILKKAVEYISSLEGELARMSDIVHHQQMRPDAASPTHHQPQHPHPVLSPHHHQQHHPHHPPPPQYAPPPPPTGPPATASSSHPPTPTSAGSYHHHPPMPQYAPPPPPPVHGIPPPQPPKSTPPIHPHQSRPSYSGVTPLSRPGTPNQYYLSSISRPTSTPPLPSTAHDAHRRSSVPEHAQSHYPPQLRPPLPSPRDLAPPRTTTATATVTPGSAAASRQPSIPSLRDLSR